MPPMRICARTGKRPQVFLASLGELAAHSARSTWMRNFLAAGGIEAIASAPLHNSADAGKAFADSGAAIACICSSDEVYAELAEATAGVLKARRGEKRAARRPAKGAGSGAEGGRRRHVRVCRQRCHRHAARAARGARCPRLTSARAAVHTGGCQCGAVRFAVYAEPAGSASATAACARRRWRDPSPCWPRCRGATSPGAGEPSTFRSSSRAVRDFCAACGTPLSYRKPGRRHHRAADRRLRRPERVPPTYAVGIESGSPGSLISSPCPAGPRSRRRERRSSAASSSISTPTTIRTPTGSRRNRRRR